MRKFTHVVIAGLAVLSALAVQADKWTDPVTGYTWTYRINGGTAEIYKGHISAAISPSPTGAVTIPSTLGGKHVTSIGDCAFYRCSGLTSVTIPDGVTNINSNAFYDCNGLKSVMVPHCVLEVRIRNVFPFQYSSLTNVSYSSVVTNIGDSAFSGCSGLKSVTIPVGVTSIGDSAFSGCSGLTEVTIPVGVTSMGDSAFSGCSGLKSVTIPDSVMSIGHDAFRGCSGLTGVTIPVGVTSIRDSAFYNCSGLKSVTIPAGVTNIGVSAFYDCIGLKSVTIPASVTSIGWDAFHGCIGLTDVTIPDGVTNIEPYAFTWCSSLTRVSIPTSVTNLEGTVFYGCSRLTNVTIPQCICANPLSNVFSSSYTNITTITIQPGVTRIGSSAFSDCSRLKSVTIPDSVMSIGSSAFSNCDNSLYDTKTVPGVRLVDGWVIGIQGSQASISGALHLTGVRGIAGNAFWLCKNLTSVTMQDGIKTIGASAFYKCTKLSSVSIPDSMLNIEREAFEECNSALFDTKTISGVNLVDGWVVGATESLPGELDLSGVRGIGQYAFSDCNGLTDVTIGNGVAGIGSYAFKNCACLMNVTILDGVAYVGDEMFFGCASLACISIPASVTKGNVVLDGSRNLGMLKLGYDGYGANTPVKLYVDDELLLSSTGADVYEWRPRLAGVHVLRRVTGPNELIVSVNSTNLLEFARDPEPNPPGAVDTTISLAQTSKTFASAKRSANTFALTSTTGSGTWTASASDDWISLSKTSGAVTEKVSYIVEANTSAQARMGYVYVSGHVHTVIQPGTGVSISSDSIVVDHRGIEQEIVIDTTADGASWYARPEAPWISVWPTSGNGDDSVAVQVAPFYEVATRTGSATIAGETVTITQRGRDMQLMTYTTNVTAAAQFATLAVAALPDVPWSVVSGASWITVSYAGSGLGSSTIDLALAANTSYLSRTGMVVIGTETFTVTQAGTTALSFEIAASSVSVQATATAAKTIKITATPDLPWTITSNRDWLAPISNYRTGAGTKTVAYSVAANPTLASRTGVLTFAPAAESGLPSRTLTVTQTAAVSSIAPESASVSAAATTVSVEVTVDAVVGWTVSSGSGWVTFEGSGSRTGPGTVVLHVGENTSLAARDGSVTIAGHEFPVHQAGGTIGISATSNSVSSAGGNLYIGVTGSANLNWSIQNATDWVTVEGDVSRTGPATLVIRVAANTGTEARSCEIMIGGQKLTIEQAAAGTSVEEDVLVYGADTDIGGFHVKAPDYLTWRTETEADDWIILFSEEESTGSADVEYIVDEIDASCSRIGVLWVGSTPVYICQSSFTTSLSASGREVSRLSGNGQVSVTVGSGNQWCAVSTVPWITLMNSQGTGNGVVQFTYDDNTTGAERTGRIIIADQVFTLTQTAADPSVPRWTITYQNTKGAANPNPNKYDEGSEVSFLALANVNGYTFAGWTPSAISASDKGNKTITASWTPNVYSIAFDANGGESAMDSLPMVYEVPAQLPQNAFSRTGYEFAGWATSAQGNVAYADRATVSNLAVVANATVTLYAKWTPISYSINYANTKGAANSNPATYTIEDEIVFAPLPNVGNYEFLGWSPASLLPGGTGETTVTAQWRLKQEFSLDELLNELGVATMTKGGNANWYSQTSVHHNDSSAWRSGSIGHSQSTWMEISVRGATSVSFWWKVSSESGDDKLSWTLDGTQQEVISGEQAWAHITKSLTSEAHTIRFTYAKDGSATGGDDCGWVGDVLFECQCPETVSLTFDLDGKGTRMGGGELAQTLPFGGTPTAPTVQADFGWQFDGWSLTERYYSDATITATYTAIPYATVDASVTGGTAIRVNAEWVATELDQRFGAGRKEAFVAKFGSDLASALTKKTGKVDGSGNELAVWHDYVAGTDPTDINSTFKAKIEIRDGVPVIEWEPNLNEGGEVRAYAVYGKAGLKDGWHSPTNALDRFFKVDVAMPPTRTVTFNVGGGSAIETVDIRVGQPIGTLPTPTWQGYDFLGWFTEAEGGAAITPETIVTEDLTIYAHWERNVAVDLVHRWSFNGDLTDSAGGQTATTVGGVTTDGSVYSTPGGFSGSAYIDLGNWIVPTNGSPVTIEMWVRQNASVSYGRIYCWGAMPTEGDFSGSNENAPEWLQMRWDGVSTGWDSEVTLKSYSVGVEYHVATVIEPLGNGTWNVTFYQQEASTGATLSSGSVTTKSGWNLQNWRQTDMVLGQTLTTWDYCAKNSYNELRIWRKAMTESELTASAIAGPDADL